jgi:hypothetical protein
VWDTSRPCTSRTGCVRFPDRDVLRGIFPPPTFRILSAAPRLSLFRDEILIQELALRRGWAKSPGAGIAMARRTANTIRMVIVLISDTNRLMRGRSWWSAPCARLPAPVPLDCSGVRLPPLKETALLRLPGRRSRCAFFLKTRGKCYPICLLKVSALEDCEICA